MNQPSPNLPKRVVIVDDDCAESKLARDLLEGGIECLHLSSRAAPALAHAPIYDAELGYVGDLEAAARLLRPLRPDAVIAGSAGGADFAVRLAAALCIPSTAPERHGP